MGLFSSTLRLFAVGINNYGLDLPVLGGCVNDANRMVDTFKEELGYDATLLDETEASRDNLLKQLREAVSDTEQGGTMVFYFAGYGSYKQVKEGVRTNVIVCADRKPVYIGELYRILGERNAIIILDCSYSDPAGKSAQLTVQDTIGGDLEIEEVHSDWKEYLEALRTTPIPTAGEYNCFRFLEWRLLQHPDEPLALTAPLLEQNVALIAGAGADQPCWEVEVKKMTDDTWEEKHGSFTAFFIYLLKQKKYLTLGSLLEAVVTLQSEKMVESTPKQFAILRPPSAKNKWFVVPEESE